MSKVESKQPKRILVIDDDQAMSRAIDQLLTHYGFEVTVASTLSEAREHFLDDHDLIVLDVMLPDGNGLDLLETIRLNGKKSRVYVLTANTQPQTDRQISRLTPNRHFRKPFNFLEILDSIRGEFAEAEAA